MKLNKLTKIYNIYYICNLVFLITYFGVTSLLLLLISIYGLSGLFINVESYKKMMENCDIYIKTLWPVMVILLSFGGILGIIKLIVDNKDTK